MYQDVEFTSRGVRLRGRLYRDESRAGPAPAVVMTNGFSATITMTADKYAEVFAEAGLTVLLFDHAGFGASEGEQGRVINTWVQARGYQDALTYLCGVPHVDAARIALWGDSLSAGEALVVAAVDPRVAAVVAQVPTCGRQDPPEDPDGELFAALRLTLLEGDVTSAGITTGPMPVVSFDQLGTPSQLTPITAFRWFIDHGARHGTGWENVATRFVPATPAPYHVGICTPHLRVPSLWLVSPSDEMPGADPAVARRAYDRAGGAKERVAVEGGHFGLVYWPGEVFAASAAVQREFLTRVLG